MRLTDDGPAPVVSKSSGQRQAQFAACRFLTLSLMKAHPDLVKLSLAHDAGQTEQQTVVEPRPRSAQRGVVPSGDYRER